MLRPNTPTFSWSQLADFRAAVLARGGSSDVGSGAEVPSDIAIEGRYARQYSQQIPDLPGRTLSFYCWVNRPGTYGAERNATYRELALSGCRPNDMRTDPDLMALVEAARASGAAQDSAPVFRSLTEAKPDEPGAE